MNAKGTIVLRERLTRAALPKRLANIPPCLIGMEACAGAHHIGRKLAHDVRLMPAKYVKPFLKGHKNDYRDAEAIAEAVQRPTMRFVPFKSDEQLDLQALHRVRSRLVGQRTAVINQIRAFLLEHGVPVRQGPGAVRQALPSILAQRTDTLSSRIIRLIEGLIDDWRRFDQRIADVTSEIEQLGGWRATLGDKGLPVLAHRVISLRCGIWSLSGHIGHRASRSNQAFMNTRPKTPIARQSPQVACNLTA